MDQSELSELIKTQEGYNLEFKETLSKSIAKEICAFANASGGKIILGIRDDFTPIGYDLSNSDKSRIQDIARNMEPSLSVKTEQVEDMGVIHVPEGKDKPYFSKGKVYLRIGPNSQRLNRNEIREFFEREGAIIFDEKYIDYDFDDFSNKAYDRFLERASISDNLDVKQTLTNLNFLDQGKMNYSGALLFSKDITKYIRNATIQCVLYQGTGSTILDKKEFSQDLVSNFEGAIDYLKSKLNTEYVIGDKYRDEYLELPEEALREALINSIAHRDYFSNAPIFVNIHIDRVDFLNPVIMDSSLTLEDLMNGSYPRNLFLFSNLERIDLVEKAGSGFLRIKESMGQYRLPMPEIKFSKRLFTTSFIRPDLDKNSYKKRVIDDKGYIESEEGLVEGLAEELVEGLVENQIKILELVDENPYISKREMSEEIGISTTAIDKNISTLKKKGLLKRVGPARGGHWEIIK